MVDKMTHYFILIVIFKNYLETAFYFY